MLKQLYSNIIKPTLLQISFTTFFQSARLLVLFDKNLEQFYSFILEEGRNSFWGVTYFVFQSNLNILYYLLILGIFDNPIVYYYSYYLIFCFRKKQHYCIYCNSSRVRKDSNLISLLLPKKILWCFLHYNKLELTRVFIPNK